MVLAALKSPNIKYKQTNKEPSCWYSFAYVVIIGSLSEFDDIFTIKDFSLRFIVFLCFVTIEGLTLLVSLGQSHGADPGCCKI